METYSRLKKWAETFDQQLNFDDPMNSSPISEEENQAFEKEEIKLWLQIRKELGENYQVAYHSYKYGELKHPDELKDLEN